MLQDRLEVRGRLRNMSTREQTVTRRTLSVATVYRAKGRPNYLIAYFDGTRTRRVRSSGTTDKRTAERLAAKLEADALLAREGIVDPRAEQFALAGGMPLTKHVSDFLAYLRDKGSTEKHVSDREGQLARLLAAGKMKRVADLTPARVQSGISQLRTVRQISLRTAERYLRAVKALSRWLVREGRAESDPLVGVAGFNPATDRRHERRELTPDEVDKLIAAAEAGAPYRGLTGPERAVLYRLALGTGFRANEIASLTPASFHLDDDPPVIVVAAAYSKRRREDHQPIRRDLADALRPWLAERPADRRVFDVPCLPHRTARLMRFDLAAAGIEYTDADSKVADFHSLRVTFISAVVRSGATVKEAQALARHSNPSLTFRVYAKTSLRDLARAVEGMGGGGSEQVTRAART